MIEDKRIEEEILRYQASEYFRLNYPAKYAEMQEQIIENCRPMKKREKKEFLETIKLMAVIRDINNLYR